MNKLFPIVGLIVLAGCSSEEGAEWEDDVESASADLQTAAAVEAPSFRVMSYNVRYENSDDTSDFSWGKRRKSVVNRINKHNPDILGLQEVETGTAEKYIRKELSTTYAVVDSTDDESKIILYRRSRFSRGERGSFTLPTTSGCTTKRTADWLVLKERSGSDTVLVVNTHFQHKAECDATRERSAEALAAFVAKRGEKRIVVMGDLNVNSNEDPKESGDKTIKKLRSSSIGVVGFDGDVETLDTPTFNSAWKERAVGGKRRLDYFFYSKATLTPSEYAVDSAKNSKGITPSDHHPIIVTFAPRS